jgi:hypothetical protein
LVVDIVLSDEKNVADTYGNCLDLAILLLAVTLRRQAEVCCTTR